MLKNLARTIVQTLWQHYLSNTPQMEAMIAFLNKKGIHTIQLDHFALIDLPGPQSGIPIMQKIFQTLGFETRGKDFLHDKQNDFLWMAEKDCTTNLASSTLPQVVVADFRTDIMPEAIARIVKKYAQFAQTFPIEWLQQRINELKFDPTVVAKIQHTVCNYFKGRDWPLPSIKEFQTVKEFNELLAWVLLFGRRANHFTLALHLQTVFTNFNEFIDTLRDKKRPLLQGENPQEVLKQMWQQREPIYEQIADFTVKTDNRSVRDVCQDILSWLGT